MCVFFLLVTYAAYCGTLVIKRLLLCFKLIKLISDTYYSKKCICLFLILAFHKFRKIKGKLFNKFIKKLLSAFMAFRINNPEVTVFALAFHNKTV